MKNVDDVVSVTRATRFLAKEDVGAGLIVTIASVIRDVVEFNNESREETVVYFQEEGIKPLILKPTVARLIAGIIASRKAKDWVGRKIELFNDPTIGFAGKVVGGIRVRAVSQPKNGSGRTRRPVPPGLRKPSVSETEDIRFG
jgi:hypothetical protein